MEFHVALSTVILIVLVLFLMLGAVELVSQALGPVSIALTG
jgi:hypothetical protein